MIRRTHEKFRWQLADDFAPLLDAVLRAPGHTIKESLAKLVTRHELGERSYYVKRYRHGAFPFRPLKFLFKRSQARQEWDLAAECEDRKVPIVRHVALGEHWSARGLLESVLITEAFVGGAPLDASHKKYFPRVIDFVQRLAHSGLVHCDFHPSNLLLNESTGEFRLLDLHGAKAVDGDPSANLRQMLVQLSGTLGLPVEQDVSHLSGIWRREAFTKRSKRCLKVNRDFTREKFGRLTWHVRRESLSQAVEEVLRDPDAFLANARIFKAGRSSTVGAANGLVLKRYNFKKPFNAVKDLFRGSRGHRGFQKAYHLELCGYPTPRVIAAAHDRLLGLPIRSYVLMEEIPYATDAGQWNGDVSRELSVVIARLHEEGFTHRDLKETNILFDGKGSPSLIDLDGLTHVGLVPASEAAANLSRLAEGMRSAGKLTRRNVIVFMHRYCRTRKMRPRLLFPRAANSADSHAHRPR